MNILFDFFIVYVFFVFFVIGMLFSKIKITIKDLEVENLQKKLNKRYKINIGIYIYRYDKSIWYNFWRRWN